MSLPNANIAKAFIEFYLNYRKATWKLDVQADSIKIPEDKPENTTVNHKISLCIDILKAINNAKTFNDYLELLNKIYMTERAELQPYENRYKITRAVIWQPFAADMLRATRTYIVSELKNDPAFQTLKSTLTNDTIALKKDIWVDINSKSTPQPTIDEKQTTLDTKERILEARNDDDTYFLTFFTKNILFYDPESKALNEKTIEDFKENIIQGKRNLKLCQFFIEADAKRLQATKTSIQPETPVVSHTVSTALVIEAKRVIETESKLESSVPTDKANTTSVEDTPSPEVVLPPPLPPRPPTLLGPTLTSTKYAETSAAFFPTAGSTRRQPPRSAKIPLATFSVPQKVGADGQPLSYPSRRGRR